MKKSFKKQFEKGKKYYISFILVGALLFVLSLITLEQAQSIFLVFTGAFGLWMISYSILHPFYESIKKK